MKCSVDECTRDKKYNGMCGMHYKRWYRYGDPNRCYLIKELPKVECKVEGCTELISHSIGLCKVHEQRFRRYGRLENIMAPKGAGGFDVNGYYIITVNGRRVYQHRKVMEEKLGRELRQGEVVHHIDGNRWNNELDNLELFENHSAHMKHHAAQNADH